MRKGELSGILELSTYITPLLWIVGSCDHRIEDLTRFCVVLPCEVSAEWSSLIDYG